MKPRLAVPIAATAALCLLLAACGEGETEVDPRDALMRFCEASEGGEACDCGVELMLESFDDQDLAVIATLADSAGDNADPANLLQEMVEGGDLAPEAARSIVETMTVVAGRIIEECSQ